VEGNDDEQDNVAEQGSAKTNGPDGTYDTKGDSMHRKERMFFIRSLVLIDFFGILLAMEEIEWAKTIEASSKEVFR